MRLNLSKLVLASRVFATRTQGLSAPGWARAKTARLTPVVHAPAAPWRVRQAPALLFALLLGFGTLLFFYRLGERDLWSSHEGRAGQNARAILDEGCWDLPHLHDFRPELQKPPLYYWLVAGLSWLRGGLVDAWSVRAPAALAGLGLVALTCGLLFALGRARAGLLAGFMLATMVHFTALARTGRIDMPLACAAGLALAAYYLGWRRALDERLAWPCWLLAALGCVAGVLLKGPIGLVLPAVVVGLHLIFEVALARSLRASAAGALTESRIEDRGSKIEDRQSILDPRSSIRARLGQGANAPRSPRARTHRAVRAMLLTLLWAVPLIVVLALPWFIWANIKTDGELWRTFFIYHNVERAFGAGELRSYPFWYYLPRLAVDMLPWSLLLPVALWQLGRRGGFRHDADSRFGLMWLLGMLMVLSCAGFKRADYLIPVYPGVALILGCWLDEQLQRARVGQRRIASIATVVAFVVFTGWSYYSAQVLPAAEPVREQCSFARAIRQHAPRPALLIFFRCEDHALAFHVGGPINTILEWENIDTWAGRPGPVYIVMPPDCAAGWPKYVRKGKLEVVLRNKTAHEQPLVLLRTAPLVRP